MKFLCLAYGDEKDWKELTEEQQNELLARDEFLRSRGDLVAAVEQSVVTVRAWDGTPEVTKAPLSASPLPFVGFSVIEAADMDEAIQLVSGTPCAVAKGAIEIRPIMMINR